MKKYKALIFDIDGTLTSTNELIFASFNYITSKHLNKTMTPEEVIRLFGPTEDQIIERWFTKTHESVKKDYYDFYLKNHDAMVDLYPGMYELLSKLKSECYHMAVFTGKGKKAAMITLEKMKIAGFFDMIITGDDVMNHKPSGEGILKYLSEYNFQKDEVLMIGDAPADITAARDAGIKVASVLWDSYAKDKVLTMDSDYIFHSVEELSRTLI